MGVSEQPLPVKGRDQIFPLVIADLRAREQRDIATYGRTLETFNGRDALQDLYEELLDSLVYLKQAILERDAR